jgi:hypothetical protein
MNKRVVLTVLAVFSVVVLTAAAKPTARKARLKGLVTPLDENLQCVYSNCLEVTLGPGLIGTVQPSDKVGFVKMYPVNQSDRSYINNRAYFLVKEDQLIYL